MFKRRDAQRVGVFIDTQNLYHSARSLYGKRVNFGKLIEEISAERDLIEATAYVVTTEDRTEAGFFEALESMGIDVKTKDLQIFSGGEKKADWDVGMVIDAISRAPKLDVIVFATGDGDFVPAVEYLQKQGCKVEAITFKESASAKLINAVDEFTDMSANKRKYLINKPR